MTTVATVFQHGILFIARGAWLGTACVILLCGVSLTGCTFRSPYHALDAIYSPLAQLPDYQRNPVVVIPGILGSRLINEKDGKVVWGHFDRLAIWQRSDGDASRIALPMVEGVPLSQLRDNVRSDGTLARLKVDIAGLPVELEAYEQILRTLGVGGYRDQQETHPGNIDYGDHHFTCFQFDYDWRRDIAENAQRLHEFLIERREYIRQQYFQRFGIADAEVKFDIVAHSMGGLIARYYLRYGSRSLPEDGSLPSLDWGGAHHVSRVVLIGTPNAGSVLALRDLVDGYRLAPLLPKFSPAVLGTMPAVYQLLPRPRHRAVVDAQDANRGLDVYDPDLWLSMQWGLANSEQDSVLKTLLPDVKDVATRQRVALEHQRKCLRRAQQLHEALDFPAALPPGLSLHLFAGDSIETPASMAVDLNTGDIKISRFAPGDDTTTRNSAILDERSGGEALGRPTSPIRWSSVMFLHNSHRGLTSDPVFTDNVLAILLDSPEGMPIPQPIR